VHIHAYSAPKFVWRSGSPYPLGSFNAPLDPLAAIKGLLFVMGGSGVKRGGNKEGREGRGREGKGGEKEKGGKGRDVAAYR